MASSVIGALRVNLGLDSAQFSKGAKQAQTTSQKLSSNLKKIGAAASAVGGGVALAVRGQLNAADQLGKSAQQLGLPVEQLSQLQFAASQSGISMSSLETGLRRLSQNMAQDADKFEALGISVRDMNGEMRPTADVMADLADVLAGMPDGAEKTALAMDLMGRSGAEMIPLLNGGADALRDMMAEADALGLTISQDTAEAAAQFNDNLGRLGGQMQGLVRIVTSELAPILSSISDIVVEVASKFQGMSPEMRRFSGIIAGLSVVLGPVLLVIGGLVAAIGAPAIGLIAVVVAVVAAVATFWPEIIAAKDAAVEFTDGLIQLGRDGVEFVKDKLRELIAFLKDLPARFREAGANMMSGLTDGIRSGVGRAQDALSNAGNTLQGGWNRMWGIQSPSKWMAQSGGDLMDGLAVGIEERDHVATAAMAGVTDKLKDQVGNAASEISGMFETAFVGIVTGAQSARQAIGQLLQSLARLLAQRAFQSLFGGLFGGGGSGFLSGLFGGFRANGGPVSAGKSYIVGERGPELFTPGASGQITSNEALRGGEPVQVVVRILPSGEFDSRVSDTAGRVAVSVVQAYDRQALPGSVQRVSNDPRRRG